MDIIQEERKDLEILLDRAIEAKMKELPDEKILLEMLEEFKLAEQAARELCELSTAIAWKYQMKVSESL